MKDIGNISEGDIVRVKWIDSMTQANDGWISSEDVDFKKVADYIPLDTVGVVYKINDDFICLRMSYSKESDQMHGIITIPIVAILSVNLLKETVSTAAIDDGWVANLPKRNI